MEQVQLYIWLLGLIVVVGLIGRKIPAPTPLLLVIAGMLVSLIPRFPSMKLDPDVVLTLFLPLLVYEASTFTSWPEVKLYKRPIALLSVGHVIFITLLVAVTAHTMIPSMSWPIAFLLGAVVSPPDDVAIFSIAEKINLPKKIFAVLTGEGLLNDATALIIFRFSVAAILTGYFSPTTAIMQFFAIIILETLYGLVLAHILGQIRLRMPEPMLQMLLSLVTPFLAYIPAVHFGGSGVLATVVTGFVIGHAYLDRFTPGSRLLWRSVWETIGFTVSSLLFLLVGLNLRTILENIANIPLYQLALYGIVVSLVVIVGRFAWVFPSAYLPAKLSPSINKSNPPPPWQYPFVVSWAGMRGGVSLAAAFAFPLGIPPVNGIDMRALVIYLVFCVITATLLIQGLSLPWLLHVLKLDKVGKQEKVQDHLDELHARLAMTQAALEWLNEFEETQTDNPEVLEEIKIQRLEYQAQKKRTSDRIENFNLAQDPLKKRRTAGFVFRKLVEVERHTLAKLWREGTMSLGVRNLLLQQLDLRAKRFAE